MEDGQGVRLLDSPENIRLRHRKEVSRTNNTSECDKFGLYRTDRPISHATATGESVSTHRRHSPSMPEVDPKRSGSDVNRICGEVDPKLTRPRGNRTSSELDLELTGHDCGKGDCATPRTRLASRETQATAAVVSAEVGVVASVRKDDCWKGDSTTHRTRLASRETQATAVVVSAEVGFAASVRKDVSVM
ncbi:uncharacterized protein LOC121860056 isoform X2 [Homarus americanus]|uniref:uncharacterized protein LOC121860056 isoform X2 n=1 Tax=Homarus americanus TaxID=6706 RepID=UPI001C47C28F|nr:uncharacterized protein LOC121860056 isoform X2 [Homarus americanus]